ncbi:MAG: cytochrome d ubiquinol oxidase subunit II [Coriobacteriia bacterium]|nr:cytochrome d ubiquinol oxidase subunit II [Coriobacteriia bacterium]
MGVEVTFLQVLWFILLSVVMVAYYILDGFDLGVGSLYPFIAKTDEEKGILRSIIGPVWDGNEVWLLTLGGALFAAFPPAYATTFSGFYLAIMLVLFSLILRAVAIHYAGSHDGSLGGFWHFGFFIGSLLPAILYGAAVGNLLNGIPLLENGDVAGSFPARFVQILGVLPLLCGVLSLLMALLQGATWTARKTHEHTDLHKRAQALVKPLAILTIVVFALASLFYLFLVVPNLPEAGVKYYLGGGFMVARVLTGVLAVVFAVLAIVKSGKNDLLAFISSSLTVAFIIITMVLSLFPALVPAATPQFALMAQENVGQTITIGAPFASSENALSAMAIIALIGVPIVLIYHVIVYKIFFGKVNKDTYSH